MVRRPHDAHPLQGAHRPRTVLTTQLFFDDNVTDAIYLAVAPYKERPLRDTRNDTDSIYDDVGLMTTQRSADGLLAAINLGLDL